MEESVIMKPLWGTIQELYQVHFEVISVQILN